MDPNGLLDPEERGRRAQFARRLYFTRLALRSVAVRRGRAAERESEPRKGAE